MVDSVVYDIEAMRQLDRAKCFFDSVGKGEAFLDDYEHQIALISKMPEAFQIRYKNVRIIRFAHFSYTIHYVYTKEVIYILQILNHHQEY